MNHFQKGGSLVSSVVCQYWSQWSNSAYSRKHSGKCFSLNFSTMAGSFRLAWPMNFADGWKYSSSFQCTAICASVSLRSPWLSFFFEGFCFSCGFARTLATLRAPMKNNAIMPSPSITPLDVAPQDGGQRFTREARSQAADYKS